MALIPSHCHSCGAVFPSRAYAFSGNMKGLHLHQNRESCPYCGGHAYLAEGVFDIAENIITIVSSPEITKEMLRKLGIAAINAYKNPENTNDLLSLAKSFNPEIGEAIEKVTKSNSLTIVGLFLLAMAIKSCSMNITLDVNELINQMKEQPPQTTQIEVFSV